MTSEAEKSPQLYLVKKTEDGYVAYKLDSPGTFLTVPDKPSAWKPFSTSLSKKKSEEG